MKKECPVCDLMNAEEADTCRHCGTAFFFELECLDRKFDDPADELVVVGRCHDSIEASLLKSVLESHGIEACVPEELTPHIYGPSSLVEMATVRVAAKNVQAAREIIAEYKVP